MLGQQLAPSMAFFPSPMQARPLAMMAMLVILDSTMANSVGDMMDKSASLHDELDSAKRSRPLMREHPLRHGHRSHRRERRRMMVSHNGQVSMASLGADDLAAPVVAEDVCPWFFDPPIHTGEYDFFLCYNGSCRDEDEDRSCCAKRALGGTFQCPANRPYMCSRRACDGDYCCKVSESECQGLGGRRPCEGPPGHQGPRGLHHGRRGSSGPPGKVGAIGPPGDPGPVVVKNHGRTMERPLSWSSLGCAMALNVVMVLASIASLIYSTSTGGGKASGEADVAGDGDYDEGEDDYQYDEGEDAHDQDEVPNEGNGTAEGEAATR